MGIVEIISTAIKTLFSRFGKTILSFLANGMVIFALSFVVGLVSAIPFIGVIALIVMYVILVPIQYGFIKQFISLYNDEYVNAFDFVQLGINDFRMVWKVVLSLLSKCIGVIILVIISVLLTDKIPFLSTLGMLVSCIWIFMLSLKYAFVYNELAHDANRTASEIIETTAENMLGNKGKLILLEVVLIALAFIISLLTGIPVLGLVIMITMVVVFIPVLQYASIIFYEDVRNTKIQNHRILENVDVSSNDETQGTIQND